FEFVADYTSRTYVQFFFNQSGEVVGNGRESGTLRPSDKEVTAEGVILDFKKAFLDKAAADGQTNPIAVQAIADHFDRVNATLRGRTAPGRGAGEICGARLSPAALVERTGRPAGILPVAPGEEQPHARRSDSRLHRQHSDVALLLLSRGDRRDSTRRASVDAG